MTQAQDILAYLKEHGSIDRLSASVELGIFELSARICELEHSGIAIDKKRRSGISARGRRYTCVVYSLRD